ncbi:MAG: hypothetical protein ACTSQE_08390 [Candidatus Heimdallarchaeaceae archaeon]
MDKLDEDTFSYVLEKILELKLSPEESEKSRLSVRDQIFVDKNRDIYYSISEAPREGERVDSTALRKIYTGTLRKKDPLLYLKSEESNLKGAFSIKNVRRVWKYTSKAKLKEVRLIPFENNPNETQFLMFIFPDCYFKIRAVKQLFPTNNLFKEQMDEKVKYAGAYQRFKELVPFKVDQIIDLLSTEQIAYSIEEWESDPFTYDIPNVDTANISLAKKIMEELPYEELQLLVKTIRDRIAEIDWGEEYDEETLERYKYALQYAKNLRKIRKEEEKR